MAVNRGFVQLISLTVYCWLETFASWEEDLSMPAKCFSALPYIYSCRVQGMSLCPHAFFVFLSYASKPLWRLCVFFPPLANFVIASQKKNVSCSCCWVLPKATHGRSKVFQTLKEGVKSCWCSLPTKHWLNKFIASKMTKDQHTSPGQL